MIIPPPYRLLAASLLALALRRVHQAPSYFAETRGVAGARQVRGKNSSTTMSTTSMQLELAEFDPARTAACAIIQRQPQRGEGLLRLMSVRCQ